MHLGLYIHIPYCSALCHYCDFSKTARWSPAGVSAYIEALHRHVDYWFKEFPDVALSSVYFGGGTPGLFADEYARLMELIRARCLPDCEITLEANPNNLTSTSLRTWRSLGFNRLSVGVQTFSPTGLEFLKRDHSEDDIRDGLLRAREFFSNISADLIYGLPGQSREIWQSDLHQLLELQPDHVSLYSLTYAAGTPIGRAQQRGRVQALDDIAEEQLYRTACRVLANSGFIHYEVSNWGRPGYVSRHNSGYWHDRYFFGIGAGAFGYVPDGTPFGLRYHYPQREQGFAQQSVPPTSAPRDHLLLGIAVDRRDADSWLTECVGTALRTKTGVDLALIRQRAHKELVPRGFIAEALAQGVLRVVGGHLCLDEAEWFRENRWCSEVIACFADL